MALNGMALLSAVALVATIDLMGCFIWKTDNMIVRDLSKEKVRDADDVYATLKSVKNPVETKIGTKFTVAKMLERADAARATLDQEPSDEDCQYDAISTRVSEFADFDDNLFLNVFKLIYPRLMNCHDDRVLNIYHNHQVLAKLNMQVISDRADIGLRLSSLKYKDELKIGNWTVERILKESNNIDGRSIRECYKIDNLIPGYIEDDRRILVHNLVTFDSGNQSLLKKCAEDLKWVFKQSVEHELNNWEDREKLQWFYVCRYTRFTKVDSLYVRPLCSNMLKAYFMTKYIRRRTGTGPSNIYREYYEHTKFCVCHHKRFQPFEDYRSLLELSWKYEFLSVNEEGKKEYDWNC